MFVEALEKLAQEINHCVLTIPVNNVYPLAGVCLRLHIVKTDNVGNASQIPNALIQMPILVPQINDYFQALTIFANVVRGFHVKELLRIA